MEASQLVRLQPRHASEEEIRETNERFRAQGWRTRLSLDVEETLQEMGKTHSPSEARLRSWLLHPDERIVGRAIGLHQVRYHDTKEQLFRRLALLRALGVNARENLLWNPLLDAFDEARLWPQGKETGWGVGPVEGIPLESPIAGGEAAMIGATLRLRLAQQVAADTTQELARQILRSRSTQLLEYLASGVPQVPEIFVDAALQRDAFLQSLLKNKSVTASQLSRLRMGVMRKVSGSMQEAEKGGQCRPAFLVSSFVKHQRWEATQAADFLVSSLPLQPAASQAPSAAVSDLLNALTLGPIPLNAAHVAALVPFFHIPWVVQRLASRSDTPKSMLPDLARRLHARGQGLDEMLRRHPDICGHDEVIPLLPTERVHWDLWPSLIRYAHGPSFRYALVQSLQRDPLATWKLLLPRLQDPRVHASLYAADLAPLLALADPQVRERVVRVVGQLQEGAPTPLKTGRGRRRY